MKTIQVISLIYQKFKKSTKLCFHISPKYFIGRVMFTLFVTPLPVLMSVLWKWIIDDLLEIDRLYPAGLVILALSYFSLLLLQSVAGHVYRYIDDMYSELRGIYVEKIQIEMSSNFDLGFFDSSQKQNLFSELSSSFSDQTEMCWSIFQTVSSVVSFSMSLVIIARYRWWIAVLTVALTLPKLFYFRLSIRRGRDFRASVADLEHEANYYRQAMIQADTLTEIRSNDAERYFETNYIKRFWNVEKKTSVFEIKSKALSLLFSLLTNVSNIIVIFLAANAAASGAQTVGSVEYLWSNNSNLQNNTSSLIGQLTDMKNRAERVQELQDYCKENTELEKREGKDVEAKCPAISFEHVSFSYPETQKEVLSDCSFTIEPGEKVGLIGLNGSGKSTIVKLLLNMYLPDRGCIKINGCPVEEYQTTKVRGLFSAVFQDTPTYVFLPVRDGIAISDYKNRDNDAMLDDACRKSGFDRVLQKKGADYDTVLNDPQCIRMENSMDFSGGEWQKLATARAYFRDAPVYVLDEPSASMDIFAEKALFDQFGTLLRDKSIVLITHRLSNVVMCDKILVLEDGRIIEQGSHRDLLAKNGRYAQLFHLQAEKYV